MNAQKNGWHNILKKMPLGGIIILKGQVGEITKTTIGDFIPSVEYKSVTKQEAIDQRLTINYADIVEVRYNGQIYQPK